VVGIGFFVAEKGHRIVSQKRGRTGGRAAVEGSIFLPAHRGWDWS
jgi:hypothetical protein